MSSDRLLTPAEQRRFSAELSKLERSITELENTTRILLTSALLRDGHATSWHEASLLARDLPAVRGIYGIES